MNIFQFGHRLKFKYNHVINQDIHAKTNTKIITPIKDINRYFGFCGDTAIVKFFYQRLLIYRL